MLSCFFAMLALCNVAQLSIPALRYGLVAVPLSIGLKSEHATREFLINDNIVTIALELQLS